MSTKVKEEDVTTPSGASPLPETAENNPARARILDAAFAAFSAKGYEQTSMLEIATRAKVSKRELYALIGTKEELLIACITARAQRMRSPLDLPAPGDRDGLAEALRLLGERLLRELSDPIVIGVFRLAIAEAERVPEIAGSLDAIGRAAARAEVTALFEQARTHGLLIGDPREMTPRFLALLWGDLQMDLLLGLAEQPTVQHIERRAQAAAAAMLRLMERLDP